MFLLHYVQRTFVFPLLIRGGKPTPLIVFLMAFFYCVANGYMQSHFLMQEAVYPPQYLRSTQFVAGAMVFFVGMN